MRFITLTMASDYSLALVNAEHITAVFKPANDSTTMVCFGKQTLRIVESCEEVLKKIVWGDEE